MTRFDQDSGAECFVYTYKEGLLSRMAHDLKIRVTKWSVQVGEDSVEATFDPRSLRVVNAMKNGREAASLLSGGDKSKIESSIVDDVLKASRHAELRFVSKSVEGDDAAKKIDGELTLFGATRPVRVDARLDGDTWVAKLRLHQPDFGIKPYKAALGALKLKPDVEVEVRVPKG